MTDDLEFPIVLGMKPLSKLGMLAVSVLLFGYGVAVQGSDHDVRLPIGGTVTESTFGVFSILLGLGVGLAIVQAMATGRPKVVIDRDGLTFSPNFGAVRQIAWGDIDSMTPYSNRYASGVAIRTRDDRSIRIPALAGSARDLHDIMVRCATAAGAPPTAPV